MKPLVYLYLGIALCCAACNNNKPAEKQNPDLLPTSLVNNPRSAGGANVMDVATMPTLDFKDTVHDFGTIHEGDEVEYEFDFTNRGKSPLLIGNATASCGCTTPYVPKDPVAPGGSNMLKVKFNSHGKSGHVEKTVTINDNTARGVHYLVIKADIISADK